MKIDRHNYEEYFILYMDNELGSDDRRQVEAFVLNHPDLKEELDLLLQYKLSPDTEIVFRGKEELIKINGETPITLANYQERLVLYIDNELNPDQIKEVEKFVAGNPSVQEELVLLQRTKLQPEQIVFAHKESLYRREEKVRTFPVRWWRAVAAVLVLALGLTAIIVFNNKPSLVKGNIANSNPGLKDKLNPGESKEKTTPVNAVIMPKEPLIAAHETAVSGNIRQPGVPSIKEANKNMTVNNNNTAVKNNVPYNTPSPVKKEESVVAEINKPSNNLPQPINNPNINKNNATNDAVASIHPPIETITPTGSLTNAPVTNVFPASYTNNNDAGQLEEGGKNNKSRGFFRKLVRTFEKRTNMTATDNDRLLVGGVAFKLK